MIAAERTTAEIAIGCRHENAISRPPPDFTARTTSPSALRDVAFAFGSSHQHRIGVTVSETTSDARMLTM